VETLGSIYGTCSCTAAFEPGVTDARIAAAGRIDMIKNVPRGVCPRCAATVYKPAVLEAVQAALASTVQERRA
jgi:hypothetical protein